MIEKIVKVSVQEDGFDSVSSKVNRLDDQLDALIEQNESVAKSFQNSSNSVLENGGAMGLLNDLTGGYAMMVKDAVEASDLFTKSTKAQTFAQSIYTTVVGTSTGAMKAFRIALAATGVGALVVGLGLLIANFDKVSKYVGDLIDRFGGWRKVLMFALPPIYLIIKGLEQLGIIETEAEEKSRKAWEARMERMRKEIDLLEKKKGRITEAYDFEIQYQNALGKNTEKLEDAKRKELLKTNRLIIEGTIQQLREGAKLTKEQVDQYKEATSQIKALNQEQRVADAERWKEQQDKAKENAEKLAELRKKQIEEQKKKAEEYANFLKQLEENRIKYLLEFADMEAEFNQQRIDKNLQAEELVKSTRTQSAEAELEAQYQEGLAKIQLAEDNGALLLEWELAFEGKRKELADKRREEEIQAETALWEQKKQVQLSYLDFAQQGIGIAKQLGEKNKGLQKALVIAENAAGIAKIIINTQVAVAKNNATLGTIAAAPFNAAAYIGMGLGIASTLLATRKALAELGGGSAGSSSGGGGTSSTSTPPQFNIVGQNTNNQLAQTIGAQQNRPVQAFVVGNEVTTQQALDRNRVQTATFN